MFKLQKTQSNFWNNFLQQLDLPMEKPLESRLRSSKSATPPKLPIQPPPPVSIPGGGVLGDPRSGDHTPSPELSEKPREPHRLHKHHTRRPHPPVTTSKSVSPPTRVSQTRSYLSATHSDASTTHGVPPQPVRAPRMRAPHPPPPSSVVINSQPTIPMALTTEKSKLLVGGGVDPLGHSPFSDKDCSYVKFPRKTSHEYSYPKLIDAYRNHDNTGGHTHQSGYSKKAPPSSGGTPPLPAFDKPTASSSTTSSGSSTKKSRRSLPSLVLSCHQGGGADRNDPQGDEDSSRASLSPLGLSDISTSHLCIHCRKSFNPAYNTKGACRYAPNDWARSTIETVTCLSCARCLLYHCISDPEEDDEVHDPCECRCSGNGSRSAGFRRWLGLSLLSILVPCLCCYPPLLACYRGAAACRLCGGRHEASKGQLS